MKTFYPPFLPLTSPTPIPLIIDTDMGFDVDDVGSLCLANALMDLGEAKILAVVHDTAYYKGVGAVSVLNHYYGHDNITLGAYKGPFGKENWQKT